MRLIVALTVLISCEFIAAGRVRDGEEVFNLFEGDIELVPQTFRSAINEKQKLWPHGRVPYVFEDPKGQITNEQRANVTQAILQLQQSTCVRWVKKLPEDVHYVRFQKGFGCSSNLGMLDVSMVSGTSGQTIRLSDECFQVGKILHEMLHALGFFHEQSRWDRDNYVRIIQQNVEQGKMSQFRTYDTSKQNKDLGLPYDYDSIMHYPRWAFSQDDGLDTLVPLRPVEIGQRLRLSKLDIYKINKLYQCRDHIKELPPVLAPAKSVVENDTIPYETQQDFACTFEYEYMCGMRDELDSQIDWKLGKGPVSTFMDTGPRYTSDFEECCYIYVDSLARQAGDKGTIVTPVLRPTGGEQYCLTFYYHMYGTTIGSLRVYLRNMRGHVKKVILNESGNKGDHWFKKNAVIESDENFEIVFEAVLGGDSRNMYEGNIALDRIDYSSFRRLEYKHQTCS